MNNLSSYNLDDGVNEYFEFIVKGNTYRFKYPTTEEMEGLRKIEGDDEKATGFLLNFINKVDEKSPDFKDIQKQMTVAHWVKFREMITKEMGLNENIKGKENT